VLVCYYRPGDDHVSVQNAERGFVLDILVDPQFGDLTIKASGPERGFTVETDAAVAVKELIAE
jgi:hypothetical protein